MCNESGCIVIQGVRSDGHQFRPSDWVDRLAAGAGRFGGDGRLHHSPWVKPATIEGERCLVVATRLEQQEIATFQWILAFAHENRLTIQHKPPLSQE